jgi:hypothetical protein
VLFCCHALFIWLSHYLTQRIDLPHGYTTLMLKPLLLIFCRHRGPTPPLPSTVTQHASQNASAMPRHLPTPSLRRLFDCCVLIHLQK